jgi:hypothetical protein
MIVSMRPVIKTPAPVARPVPRVVPQPPQEEKEYASDDDSTSIPFDITSKIIDKKDDSTFFINLSFRELGVYSDNWCYNRTICDEKVAEIYKSICDGYQIPFILHAVYDENHSKNAKILIIDGQHRKKAANMYIAEKDVNMDCPYSVWICVYKINNSETNNTNTVIDLFKRINNNRIFDAKELPNTFIVDLTKSICEIPVFRKHNVIKTGDNNSKAHPPCIHKKELHALFNQYQDDIRSSGKSIPDLTRNVQVINHKLSMMKFEDLYTVGNRQAEEKRYHAAVAKKFFLNLRNSKYGPDIWIKYIADPDKMI